MSAVILSLDAARAEHIWRAGNRAKSKSRAFGYCRVICAANAKEVMRLMRVLGWSEDRAIAHIVKPMSAPHFDPDPPTRPAA